jgi:TRAP-type mannitol/chloroaromatic compound transport system permease small subunit
VGLFVFLVPVLLVVVLGYAVGYVVWEATGLGGNPEVAGWLTGLMLLAGVVWLLLSGLRRRARRARVRGRADAVEAARLRAESRRRRGRS